VEEHPPTITWLMGMKISFTKKPMKPVTKNPTAVNFATFKNSFLSGFSHRFTSLQGKKKAITIGNGRLAHLLAKESELVFPLTSRYSLQSP
jgi:hypothetical protein